MTIINDRTTNLSLPLPNVGNSLQDDVERIRLAITGVDAYLASVSTVPDANKPVSTQQANADTAALNAAKTYADGLVVGLWDDRGGLNATSNAYPTTGGSGVSGAIMKGDIWTISTIATSGPLSGYAVGTTLRALVNSPLQSSPGWAIASVGLGYVPENLTKKNSSDGYPGLVGYKLQLRDALNTFGSFFTNAATAARTWTMPDKDGTVALLSDIPVGLIPVSLATHVFNTDGTLASMTEVTTQGTRTSTYAYASGWLSTITIVLNGSTRLETYTYNTNGTLAAMTAT